MTVEQAKQILARPRFGDPECIRAIERLRNAECEPALRDKLRGKLICPDCGAMSQVKPCWHCGKGEPELVDPLLPGWDKDILESALEELADDQR